ncbi:DNA damage-regulated autophagy modulator protein 1-like [Patiria miniata]|uniref:CWH43-like N-terminal domain-containing protein n=1 Tax=Patiria miniata TaxID=46514 RepID=A0A914BSH1_PATMI|nr:DNA damage-regulated autophagy modulator protein 1-like [Patiria miniata]
MPCGLAWLPISSAVTSLGTIIVTYILAVANEHIFLVLPYISDTGVHYPESSLFSLFLDVSAALFLLTAYVRYHHVRQFEDRFQENRLWRFRRVNRAGLIVSAVAGAGLVVLANFPEDKNLLIHLLGAFFCFTFGVAYCLLHSWLSYRTRPTPSPTWVCVIRLVLSCLGIIHTSFVILFGTVLRWHADSCNPQIKFRRISALFEWLLVVTFNLYTLTFTYEFRHIQMATLLRHWTGASWEFMELPADEAQSVIATGRDVVKQIDDEDNNDARYPCLHLDGTVHTVTICETCSVEGKAHPV